MSIALNASMLDEKPTGVGIYTYYLINRLFERAGTNGTPGFTVFSPTCQFLNKDIRIVKLSNLLQSSRYGKLSAVSRFLWNSCIYPYQARGFDLAISPTTHGSFFLRNQIITIHDLISLRYKNISTHQRFYFKRFLPLLLRRSKVIIAISEATKRDIIHYLHCPEEKIVVIHNGYDKDRYQNVAPGGVVASHYNWKNFFVAVGPTYPHKNFERLLRAYQSVDKAISALHPLVIVGGLEPYLSKIKDLTHELGLDHSVHFAGYVSAEHMPHFYREAFALIFPSLHEGFGFPLLEAMASGCPVLCAETSSMPEVCGAAAKYFDPLSVASIRQSIETLSLNPELREALIAKGIEQAKRFSWDNTATAFITLINKQLSKKKPSYV